MKEIQLKVNGKKDKFLIIQFNFILETLKNERHKKNYCTSIL